MICKECQKEYKPAASNVRCCSILCYIRNNIVINSKCWVWTGPTNRGGYGIVNFYNQKFLAHRILYKILNGVDLRDEDCVCHTCDNPKCVNPDHLWIGTRVDNNKDRHEKGRTHRNPKLLSEDKVRNILKRYFENGELARSLAKEYNVSLSYMVSILKGDKWKHLDRSFLTFNESLRREKLKNIYKITCKCVKCGILYQRYKSYKKLNYELKYCSNSCRYS